MAHSPYTLLLARDGRAAELASGLPIYLQTREGMKIAMVMMIKKHPPNNLQ